MAVEIAMGSDDYKAIGGGGALKLKGAKISKKKKKAAKLDLEKNLSGGDESTALVKKNDEDAPKEKRDKQKSSRDEDRRKEDEGEREEDDEPVVLKTDSERRYEEARKKRVSKEICFHGRI